MKVSERIWEKKKDNEMEEGCESGWKEEREDERQNDRCE